jgi:hypothetical protein
MQSTLFGIVQFQTPEALKPLEIFVSSNFVILFPQCSTHYTHDGRDDVFDIVIYQKFRLSEVIVTNIQDSDHISAMLSILDRVRTREVSDRYEELTDRES